MTDTQRDGRRVNPELARWAAILGDDSASDERILRIASRYMHNKNPETFSDDELRQRLRDTLGCRASGSLVMEEYIVSMMEELIRRRLFLADTEERSLEEKAANAMTDTLRQMGETYLTYRIRSLPEEEAINCLKGLGTRRFQKVARDLARTQQGSLLLDGYYVKRLEEGRPLTWELLNTVCEETAMFPFFGRTRRTLQEKARVLYQGELLREPYPVSVYHDYLNFMGKLVGGTALQDCRRQAAQLYWMQMRPGKLNLDKESEYRFFEQAFQEGRNRRAPVVPSERIVCEACQIFLTRGRGVPDENDVLYRLNRLFVTWASSLSAADREAIRREGVRKLSQDFRLPAHFIEWSELARDISSQESFVRLLHLKTAMEKMSYKKAISELKVFLARSGDPDIPKRLAGILIAVCDENEPETEEAYVPPVPLDIWMMLSACYYGNAFDVFDHYDCYLLGEKADRIVQESTLFEHFSTDADLYIKKKGAEARFVRKLAHAYHRNRRGRARHDIDLYGSRKI